jgi:hypothetical protein
MVSGIPRTLYTLYRTMGAPWCWSAWVWKEFPSPAFELWTFEPVASLYTDWAIPAACLNISVVIRYNNVCKSNSKTRDLAERPRVYGSYWTRCCKTYRLTCVWKQILPATNLFGVRGGAVGWGTALLTGRSRVWLPMVSLEFFSDVILPVALWPWGLLRPLTEMSTRNPSWG